MSRHEELSQNLRRLRDRVAAACATVGRDPDELTVVAVTKTFPASDVRLLAGLGVHDVGENKDQEARVKHAECADLDLRWHFVGQLQRNKCRSVAGYADVVHSVDRLELVELLARHAAAAGRPLTALVQVCLDDQPGRGGAAPAEVPALADAVASAGALVLGGLMAVAPLGRPPGPAFAHLQQLSRQVRERHPAATVISAGMSADLEAAVAHGATHLRIGTALLGHRASPVG